MASIDVKSSAGCYTFAVGKNILADRLKAIKENHPFDSCFLFVDENVWAHHRQRISELFDESGVAYQTRIIPAGERSKSVQQWKELVDYLLTSGVRRNTPLFAIGGGVTGDLAGFAAASALRGIPLVHIPTTLLAMVDSSIGGKTGINHKTGKNLIGAFYQPLEVIADTSFLETLPKREWRNGLSEVLKYGAIRDKSIFDRSEMFFNNTERPDQNSELIDLVLKCAEIKAEIVAEDEFESGVRAHLNFGHTFAHALEKEADFELLNHGEAVYLGMLAAIKLSNLMDANIDPEPVLRFRSLYEFKISRESLHTEQLMKTMKSDKKVVDKNYRFVLLDDWQQPVVKSVNNKDLITQAWLTVFNELT